MLRVLSQRLDSLFKVIKLLRRTNDCFSTCSHLTAPAPDDYNERFRLVWFSDGVLARACCLLAFGALQWRWEVAMALGRGNVALSSFFVALRTSL